MPRAATAGPGSFRRFRRGADSPRPRPVALGLRSARREALQPPRSWSRFGTGAQIPCAAAAVPDEGVWPAPESHCQAVPALRPPPLQDPPSALGPHPDKEPVGSVPLSAVWLKSPLHKSSIWLRRSKRIILGEATNHCQALLVPLRDSLLTRPRAEPSRTGARGATPWRARDAVDMPSRPRVTVPFWAFPTEGNLLGYLSFFRSAGEVFPCSHGPLSALVSSCPVRNSGYPQLWISLCVTRLASESGR